MGSFLPKVIYSAYLEKVDGINFTQREIDIMACLIHGRATKKIASFLDITPKTVENHAGNIMAKLECHSREGIIDFIEKSGKYKIFRRYYLSLSVYKIFEKQLKNIKIEKESGSSFSIIYEKGSKTQDSFVHQLEADLKVLEIKTSQKTQTHLQSISELTRQDDAIICILQSNLIDNDHSLSIQDLVLNKKGAFSNRIIFLYFEENDKNEPRRSLSNDNLANERNYYFLFFEVLAKLFPNTNLEEHIIQFREQYESLQNSFESGFFQSSPEEKVVDEDNNIRNFVSQNKWILACLGGAFLFGLLYALNFFPQTSKNIFFNQEIQDQNSEPIRSDINTPHIVTLLERPNLLARIDEKLKEQKDIPTIALVGIGGAGKTTLARQYAKAQNADVVWEINAETPLSLALSFEKLSQALAKTEEEKRTLKRIQGIQNPLEKEYGIIQFVTAYLKLANQWCLIFDNVEEFSKIQKYLPRDIHVWGKGKIIITTRDSNIHNNNHIPQTVQIGELDTQEKFLLFTKIMHHGEKKRLAPEQIKEIKNFLTKIPPLPLDISTAAYYIKTANLSYSEYLERLKKYENEFINIEENILKELNDYAKTRYKIITLSIKQLLKAHKDFADLLLFISLLDSQHIPRNVLDKYKGGVIVDNFIYHLKKYSLISDEYPPSSPLAASFSLHRSTQAIMLNYLNKILNLEKDSRLIQSLTHTLGEQVAEAVEKGNTPLLILFQRHCETFLNHEKLLKSSMQGSIAAELGRTYLFLGNYIKAKELLEKGYAILRINPSPNYPRALTYMGILYRGLGDYEKAIFFLCQSLSLNKKPADQTSQTTAMTLAFLGEAYRETGNYEKAKACLQESLKICNAFHADNKDECIPRALAHLGIICLDMGDYEKARTLLEKSHLLFKECLSESGMAMTLTFLGETHRALGDLEKARNLLEQALIIYKKIFSDSHLSISRAQGYLGVVYGALGRYEEGKALLTKGHKIYEAHFGRGHIAPTRFLSNMGKIYFLEGNIQLAEEIMEKSLTIFSRLNHPEAYIPLEDLANLNLKKCFKCKKDEKQKVQFFESKAFSCLKQALDIVNKYFPEDSSHNARIRSKLKSIEE